MKEFRFRIGDDVHAIRVASDDEVCLRAATDIASFVGRFPKSWFPPLSRRGLRLIDRAIVKASREMRGVG